MHSRLLRATEVEEGNQHYLVAAFRNYNNRRTCDLDFKDKPNYKDLYFAQLNAWTEHCLSRLAASFIQNPFVRFFFSNENINLC